MTRHWFNAVLVGALAVIASPAAAGTIGPVINPANGHAYYVTDALTTWDASEAWAIALGGHLVTINDAAENAWVVDSLQLTSDSYWIGARDDANSTDTVFDWVTGEPWSYTNWSLGEPDDEVLFGGHGDYVVIAPSTSRWYDTLGFIPQAGGIAEVLPKTGVGPASSEALLSMRTMRSRGGVTVRLELSREMHVQLSVFDVLGRPVRTLFIGVLPAGARDFSWDERDGQGRRIGAGLYFVSGRGEGIRRTGRVIVAR